MKVKKLLSPRMALERAETIVFNVPESTETTLAWTDRTIRELKKLGYELVPVRVQRVKRRKVR